MADKYHSSTSQHNSQHSTGNNVMSTVQVRDQEHLPVYVPIWRGGEVVVLAEDDSRRKHEFSEDEEILIARMFNLVGERWALIAGRIPGRSAQEIEKYWISRYSSSQ